VQQKPLQQSLLRNDLQRHRTLRKVTRPYTLRSVSQPNRRVQDAAHRMCPRFGRVDESGPSWQVGVSSRGQDHEEKVITTASTCSWVAALRSHQFIEMQIGSRHLSQT
jgi:hypothetical protein